MEFRPDIPKIDKEKNKLNFVNFDKDFNSYEKKYFISPNKFKEIFNILLENPQLFDKFSGRLDILLNTSIDEMAVIEFANDYSDNAEEKISKALNKKIDSYFNEIFLNYKNSSFPEKIKIISFLIDFYGMSIFNNNLNSREKISKFFNEILKSEKSDSGNYYIFSHLNALEKGNEDSTYTQISQNQYAIEKFVPNEEGDISKGNYKSFISKPENFQKISELFQKFNIIKNKKEKSENDKEKLYEYADELEEDFTEPLTESSFRPYIKQKDSKDNFFDHKFFRNKSIRDDFKQKTGFSLEENSLPEQYNFFEYTKEITNEEAIYFFSFLRKYGKNSFRTFLSLEQGGKEMGNKIMELGEKLPKEVAEKIFAKYGEIIDTVNDTQKILEEILPEETIENSQKEIVDIKDSLLIRAQKLLSTFYDKKNEKSDDLLKDLERYKSEILLYGDTYKKLKQEGKEIPLESFKNTEITILSQEEKEKLAKNIWDITIANRPFINDQEKINKREQDFNKTIEDKNSEFYVLKHKDNILAFCTVTPDKNGDLYAESLNVESEIKGAQIGSEFFPAIIDIIKSRGKDIYGHVHEKNKGTLPYYQKMGFEIKEVNKNGELKYEIRIPTEKPMAMAA